MILALEEKKIDAGAYSHPPLEVAVKEQPEKFKILPEPLLTTEVCMAISPTPHVKNLEAQVNEFLEKHKSDGSLDKIVKYWMEDNNTELPNIPEPDNPTETLIASTSGTIPPYNFYVGDKIFFHGEEMTDNPAIIRRLSQKIGMVFQSFNLFSNMNVLENIITAPIMLKSIERFGAIKNAKNLLEMVGLSQKITSYPDELIGGQKQRIAIVRTLAMEPEIILFDEPTSALDPSMVDEVLSIIC